MPPAEEILPECKILIEGAAEHVNGKFRSCLNSIESASIHYASNQGYVDTFEPGQESADGYTVIIATIPLIWQESKKCPK